MAGQKITLQEAIQAIRQQEFLDDASIAVAQAGAHQEVSSLVIDLDTANYTRENPKKISIPFRSVYVEDASDNAANINFIVDTIDDNQGSFKLSKKDSIEFPKAKIGGYIYFDQQAGKTLTLKFFKTGLFRTGTQQNEISNAADGSAITDYAAVSATTTRAVALASNSNRGRASFYNDGPDRAYIGGSGVTIDSGAAPGIPVEVGDIISYNNTGDIYVISEGTSEIFVQEES